MAELIKIEEITTSISNAGDVLTKNVALTAKAVEGAQALIDSAASGMSDELDAAMNEWQLKAKQALDINNKRRTPITQTISLIVKSFTEQESKLDPKKPDSKYSEIQGYRNAWAKKKTDEAKAKEQEVLRKQNFDKEKIAITGEAERQLRAKYNDVLFKFKTFANSLYNSLDLTNEVEVTAKIKNVKENYPLDDFNKISLTLFATYLTTEEVEQIERATKELLYDEIAASFKENMEAEKLRLLDLIPSRMNELMAIHKAGAAEKKRLEEEAEKRRNEHEATLKKEQEELAAKTEANIKAQQDMQTAGTLFDTQAQLQMVSDVKASTVESYKVEVKSADGWGAIFLFWFEHEAKGLESADIEKKTMKQIKAFVEKKASKENIKISHDDVVYIEDVKAKVVK